MGGGPFDIGWRGAVAEAPATRSPATPAAGSLAWRVWIGVTLIAFGCLIAFLVFLATA